MTDRLLGFAGVCVLLTFVPGVDTAMATRSALARRAGLETGERFSQRVSPMSASS